MVDPVRNSPNMGSLAVNDQKKSGVARTQTSQCLMPIVLNLIIIQLALTFL